MENDSEFSVHDARIKAAVSRRAVRLSEAISAGKLDVSERIAAAVENRGNGTEFDALAELALDEDPQVREEAARTIEFHAEQSNPPVTPGWEAWFVREETAKILLDGLEDGNPHVRRHLLRAYLILKFGDPADVLPALVRGLRAEQEDLRIAALRAIQAVGRDLASGVVAAIVDLADDPMPRVRSAVYAAMKWLGENAHSAMPRLVARLREEDERELRRQLARAVVEIDPQGETLREISDPQDREVLLDALSESGESASELRRRLPQVWEEADTASSKYVWLNKKDIASYLDRDESTIRRWFEDGRLRHHGMKGEGRGLRYAMDPDELRQMKEFLPPRPDLPSSPDSS